MFFRRASFVAALLFLFSAALQINDPDPIPWVALYVAAGIVSASVARRAASLPWYVPTIVGSIALVWGAAIGQHALGRIPLLSMFRSWEMKDAVVEENRESIGLFIVAAWMAIVVVQGVIARRRLEARSGTSLSAAGPETQ